MKICFLSSTMLGKEVFGFLSTLKPIISYANLDNEKVQDFSHLDYDLGISFLYTHKIPSTEFTKGKVWLNFHPGPLPAYRGRNLCYHAIKEGSKEFGATLHYMDENFDTGKIIKVEKFSIEPHFTAGDLNEKSRQALVSLFEYYIPKILSGEQIDGEPQDNTGKYYKQMKIAEDVSLNEDQQQQIRAVTVAPRFYAHTYIGGKKYFIVPEEFLGTNIKQ